MPCTPRPQIPALLRVQGVLEEVQLIDWPSPKTAFVQTLLVIGIVVGTSALLFAVNTLLTELSKTVYS
jgi:preprotein translocase SecE subunit